ncbi:hypothetical protein [Asticcacaulis solisilvae]|uniref:hypothetical protein n=1 Tax=Asticcacaulis solisilvae TaxID=1217274 RepID=UPI003FD8915D
MPNEAQKKFWALVATSPQAVICIALSSFLGYGISFIIFDYRKKVVQNSHYMFHVSIGLGYTAVIFCLVNCDILKHELTFSQLSARMPLTLLVSFAVGFLVLIGGTIWKEMSSPYVGAGARGRKSK